MSRSYNRNPNSGRGKAQRQTPAQKSAAYREQQKALAETSMTTPPKKPIPLASSSKSTVDKWRGWWGGGATPRQIDEVAMEIFGALYFCHGEEVASVE